MENESYGRIVGNPSAQYLNQLAKGLATNYSAITHPSLPNYLAATSGSDWGSQTTIRLLRIRLRTRASLARSPRRA